MAGDKIKGTCIRSVLNFLSGEKLLDASIASLKPRSRAEFGTAVLAMNWYPADAYIDLLDAAAHRAGADSERLMLRMGRQIIKDGLSTVYRIFLSADSPSLAVSRGHFLWRTYFQGSELRLVSSGEGSAEYEVHGESRTSTAYCLTKLGGMIGALEIVGATGVRGEHSHCRCRGDDVCRFRLTWEV